MSRAGTVALALVVVLVAASSAPAAVSTSASGVALIERFEGFVPRPAPDPVGVATVGFGHTENVRPGARWLPGQRTPGVLTLGEARRLLRLDLAQRYEPSVRRLFTGRGPLRGLFNQHRFDALTSATYNLGVGLAECSPGFASMCSAIRRRDVAGIASALLRYDRAGGMRLAGLTARRRLETALFMRPMARFEEFPHVERHLIVAFDRLHGHTSPQAVARRLRLRAALAQRAAAIEQAAHRTHDWLTRRRATRYAALLRRAGTTTTGRYP